MRIYKPAVEFRLAGIMHAQERSVLGVEFRPEIKATLLHPALEVVLGNLVRMIEERIIRLQEFDGGILISDARKGTNDRRCSFFCRRKRRRNQSRIRGVLEFVPGKLSLVLHDERSTLGHVIQQPLVRSCQLRPKFVGAHADHDGVEWR